MMKIKLITAFLILFCSSTFGQFSVEGYLSAPFQNAEIIGLEKQLDYINNESFSSPLFREMEMRIRSKDLSAIPEQFRLRLGFINPIEQRANKNYENTQTEYLEIKYQNEANLILANRYKQLIRHFFLNKYAEILTAEVKQLLAAYEQIQLKKVSFKEWIETDERILKKELKREDVNNSIELIEYLIRETHGNKEAILWDNFEVISIEKMQEVILPDTVLLPKQVELALKSYELEQKAYKIEKAESWSNIGFFQAEYEIDKDKGLNENLGFQLGFSIPLFNPDKPKLQRMKLDLLEEESDLLEIKNETSINQYELNKQFSKQIWNYKKVSERLDNLEVLGRNISYDNMEEFLAMINYHGNLRILKHEIYLECLNTYIDILALSGSFSEPPYVNYISNKLNRFSFD